MGIFDGYLLCSDIDGTLTDFDGKSISKVNREAISFFESEGGKFSIASGRYGTYPKDILKFDCNFPMIALNGAQIYDTKSGKVLWKRAFSDDKKALIIEIYDKISGYGINHVNINGTNFIKKCYCREDVEKAVENEFFKMVFVANGADINMKIYDFILKNYGDKIHTFRSCDILCEVLPNGTGKAVCVNEMKKLFPDIKKTVCVGDYQNDMEMIKCADYGFAVENATSEVKSAAKYKAPKNTENAIAYIIEFIKNIKE